MPTARQTKNNQPPSSMAALIVTVAALAAAAAAIFALPSMIWLWLGFVLAGWLEPPVLLTGPRDKVTGAPTALDEREQRRYDSYLFWRDLRTKLLMPVELLIPGRKVRATFLAGWFSFAAGWLLPVAWPDRLVEPQNAATTSQALLFGHLSNAVCAAVLVASLASVRRRRIGADCPAVTAVDLVAFARSSWWKTLAAGGCGVAVLVALMIARGAGVRFLADLPVTLNVVLALLTGGGVLGGMTSTRVRAAWQLRRETTAQWLPRWEALKVSPPPHLDGIERHLNDQWTVMTWIAPAGRSSHDMLRMADKIVATVGSDPTCLVFHAPSVGPDGEPVPASIDVNRFRVLLANAGTLRVDDANMDESLVALAHEAAMTTARRANAMDPVALTALEQVGPQGVCIWRSQWDEDLLAMKSSSVPYGVCAALGSDVLVYHRSGGAHEERTGVYVGDLESPELAKDHPDLAAMFDNIRLEQQWETRWAAGGPTKWRLSPPVAQHPLRATASLKVGFGAVEITRQPFMVRRGVDPRDYFGTESAMKAALDGASFVAITGWPAPGDRPGNRHPMALNIYFAAAGARMPTTVTSVSTSTPGRELSPASECAEAWVLAGMVNTAFDNAKLKRPELVNATCLTRRAGPNTVWQLTVRLHDGVTFADVRSKSAVLRDAFGVPWLRMEPEADAVRLYAGGTPEMSQLVRPDVDALKLANLDWAQAFVDAKLVNSEGRTPSVSSVTPLEHNPEVSRLLVALPSGISAERIRGAVSKLSPATGNGFIEVRPVKGDPSTVELMVSRTNPIPDMVDMDFDTADTLPEDTIIIGRGIEGEPMLYRMTDGAFLLVTGSQGSGKTASAQPFIYQLAAQGAMIAVVDIQKEGIDFRFLEGHTVGEAYTAEDAAALMKAVYAEGRRRMKLNREYGVGNALDLPEDVRPPRLVVVFDEFTSAMGREQLPEAIPGDAESAAHRAEVEDDNKNRIALGQFTGKIPRELRAARVSMILLTQKFDKAVADKIPGGSDLRDNLSRALVGNASQGMKMSALRSPFDAPSLGDYIPKGRGLWEPTTASKAELVQFSYARMGTEPEFGGTPAPGTLKYELDARRAPVADEDKLDLEPFRPKKASAPGVIGELPPSLRGEAREAAQVVVAQDDIDLSEVDPSDLEVVSEETIDLDDLDLDLDLDGVVDLDKDTDQPILAADPFEGMFDAGEADDEDPVEATALPPEQSDVDLDELIDSIAAPATPPALEEEPEEPAPKPSYPFWTPPPKVTTDDW